MYHRQYGAHHEPSCFSVRYRFVDIQMFQNVATFQKCTRTPQTLSFTDEFTHPCCTFNLRSSIAAARIKGRPFLPLLHVLGLVGKRARMPWVFRVDTLTLWKAWVRTREPVRENDLVAPIATFGVLVRKRRVRRVRTHTAPNGQVACRETARPPVECWFGATPPRVRWLVVVERYHDHVVRGFDAGTARSSSRGHACASRSEEGTHACGMPRFHFATREISRGRAVDAKTVYRDR